MGFYNVIRIKNLSKFLNVVKAKDSNHNNAKSADETSFCGVRTCSVVFYSKSVFACCKSKNKNSYSKITDRTLILGVYKVIRIKILCQFFNVVKVKDSKHENAKSVDQTSLCCVKTCSLLF